MGGWNRRCHAQRVPLGGEACHYADRASQLQAAAADAPSGTFTSLVVVLVCQRDQVLQLPVLSRSLYSCGGCPVVLQGPLKRRPPGELRELGDSGKPTLPP